MKLDRLALRIAVPVAAAVAGGVLLVAAAGASWIAGIALAAGAGLAAYVAAHRAIAPRLALARTLLGQIRRRDPAEPEPAPPPERDELGGLAGEIHRTGREIRHEIDGLLANETYRRELLGNVSHELKTPIFAIQGFAETLLGGALEDPRVNRKFVEKILANAYRLGSLTRDLGELSRIETGALGMTMAPFELRGLVREAAESLEPAAARKGISLRPRIPDGLPLVVGDRERIRQVLVNLMDNAVKYGNRGGQVEVAARKAEGGPVEIAVADDGIGIPAEDLPRITERFYRVDRSRSREQGGSGLGLAIVKHILEAHGQKLRIESAPGRGSRFSFRLDAAGPPR